MVIEILDEILQNNSIATAKPSSRSTRQTQNNVIFAAIVGIRGSK